MSLTEILVVVVLVLVVVGPEKLPELMRWLGRGMREIQRATNLFRDTMMMEGENPHRDDDFHDDLPEAGPLELHEGETPSEPVEDPGGAHHHESGPGAEMRPIALEPALPSEELSRFALAAADESEAVRTRYLSPPHRNLY